MTTKETKLKDTVDNNYSLIRSYVRTVACDSFWVGDGEREARIFYDPFEADNLRVHSHNAIAAAFNIPRELVTLCRETIDDGHGGETDLRTFYTKIAFREDALDETVDRFVERLVRAWHEFHEDGKYSDMVEFIASDVWVEKAAKEVNSIQGIPNLESPQVATRADLTP